MSYEIWCGYCDAIRRLPWWRRLWLRFAYGICTHDHHMDERPTA